MNHEETAFWSSVVAMLAVITVVSLVGRRLRVPVVSALVVGGALITLGDYLGAGILKHPSEFYLAWAHIVVFVLLLCHGLDTSVDALRDSWRIIVIGSAVQVVLTIIFGAIAAVFVLEETSFRKALLVGMLMATSSPAMVYHALRSRDSVHTREGFFAHQILIGHDLFLLPFGLMIAAIAPAGHGFGSVLSSLAIGIVITAGVLTLEWKFICPVLNRVYVRFDRDLFYVLVSLIIASTVYICLCSGLSPAFGMFLGGVLIARTKPRYHVRNMVTGIRDIALPLFFALIGLQFGWEIFVEHWAAILCSAFGLIMIKFAASVVSGLIVGLRMRAALRVAGLLAHIGESAFVLGLMGRELGIIDRLDGEVLIVISVLTIGFSPMLVALVQRFADLVPDHGLRELGIRSTIWEKHVLEFRQHVIIVGFGRVGKGLAIWFRDNDPDKRKVVIIEKDRELAKLAVDAGFTCIDEDACNRDVLSEANAAYADLVVVTHGSYDIATKLFGYLQEIVGSGSSGPRLQVRVDREAVAAEIRRAVPKEEIDIVCDELAIELPLYEVVQAQLRSRPRPRAFDEAMTA